MMNERKESHDSCLRVLSQDFAPFQLLTVDARGKLVIEFFELATHPSARASISSLGSLLNRELSANDGQTEDPTGVRASPLIAASFLCCGCAMRVGVLHGSKNTEK